MSVEREQSLKRWLNILILGNEELSCAVGLFYTTSQ